VATGATPPASSAWHGVDGKSAAHAADAAAAPGADAPARLTGVTQNLEFEHMFFAFIPMKSLESLAKVMRNSG
jgi:hypothetical protein